MNQRTRVLLILLGVVGVAFFGDQAYTRWVEQPAAEHERALAGLNKQINDLKLSATQARKAAKQLPALVDQSLPYDANFATARYQAWLLELVKRVNLENPSVTSDPAVVVTGKSTRAKKGPILFTRYGFTLRGRGDLRQTALLLFQFYRSGMLHKIDSLSLNPVGGGRALDVSLRIEALSLARCERRDTLPTAAQSVPDVEPFVAYGDIVRRNLFSADADAALSEIVLTGVSYAKSGEPECWFSLGSQGGTKVLRRGDTVEVGPHQLEVIDIQGERALVSLDGQMMFVELGKSAKDARVVGAAVDG